MTTATGRSRGGRVRSSKVADLAGPGIGDYAELEQVLPSGYRSLLTPNETQRALHAVKRSIEDGLARELGLIKVEVPLIVEAASGVNDYLDRDGSRTPVSFHISNDRDLHPVEAEVVQAATKWKRMALRQFGMKPGEGLVTDMRAIRKDYFLDHDHSAYVDQWDWEKVITPKQRTLAYLTATVRSIWKVLREAEELVLDLYPKLRDPRYPSLPDELMFVHAEELLEMYPDLPRKQRETAILEQYPAIFIYGIGWTLADGYPHELRAADYDDWVTETVSADGTPDARPERRHPRLEPRHPPPARAQLDGRSGDEGVARGAAAPDRAARLPGAALPPGDHERRDPPLDRRRHRPVARDDAAAAQGPPRRGERHGLAADPEGDVRGQEHRRAGVRAPST